MISKQYSFLNGGRLSIYILKGVDAWGELEQKKIVLPTFQLYKNLNKLNVNLCESWTFIIATQMF